MTTKPHSSQLGTCAIAALISQIRGREVPAPLNPAQRDMLMRTEVLGPTAHHNHVKLAHVTDLQATRQH